MDGENGRVRAWVLVKATDPLKMSAALADEYRDEERDYEFGLGGDELVVVRADVVCGEMNLVVPIDAASEEILNNVVADIWQKEWVRDILVLTVKRHNPIPSHRSSTFVTKAEYRDFPLPEYDPPGRHPESPGWNPWG